MKRFLSLSLFLRFDYRYLTNIENHSQQRRLSRSNSFDYPMELKRQHFDLNSLTHVTPRMRYSLNQYANHRQRPNSDRKHRLSLNHTSSLNNPNHQVRKTKNDAVEFLSFFLPDDLFDIH